MIGIYLQFGDSLTVSIPEPMSAMSVVVWSRGLWQVCGRCASVSVSVCVRPCQSES